MDKKQVLIRVSVETYDRLQSLSDKYGLSVSGLIVSLVNERWLQERSIPVEVEPKQRFHKQVQHKPQEYKMPDTSLADGPPLWDDEPLPNFPQAPAFAKSARKRHKPKR